MVSARTLPARRTRLNKKSVKNMRSRRLGQPNTLSWLSSSHSAKALAQLGSGFFSFKSTRSAPLLPEEPLTSEVQILLENATNVIECATGGHGRCANSACGCRCHKSRMGTRAKQCMSV